MLVKYTSAIDILFSVRQTRYIKAIKLQRENITYFRALNLASTKIFQTMLVFVEKVDIFATLFNVG